MPALAFDVALSRGEVDSCAKGRGARPLGMKRWVVRWGLVLLGLGAGLQAQTWRTVDGDTWEGKLSGVYGTVAVFADRKGSVQAPVHTLDDASLGRVADFLAAKSDAVAWNGSTSPVAKALRNRLQVLRDGKLVTFEPGARTEPDVYLVYFGALWCGPCVRFSPELVKTYQTLKSHVGDRFELVFVSSDRDGREQLDYVKKVQMPWPVLKFSAVGGVPLLERWKGRGIPCLVALTREGDVIYHSYRGEEYLGPKHVLDRFAGLAAAMRGESEEAKRALHRLAVLQHVRAAAGADAAPRPYLIGLDKQRHRTLEAKELEATIEIDAQGRVASVAFEPKLESVVEYQLEQVAQTWLFLPALKGGEPVARRVKLPLKL